jgi:hypothetical protein
LNRVLVLYGEEPSKMPADEWLGTVNNVVRMFERALADNVEAEERAERQRRIRERQQQAALARADPDKAPVRKTRGGARATMSRQFNMSKDASANSGAGMVDSLLSQVRGEKPAGSALDRVKKRNPLQPTYVDALSSILVRHPLTCSVFCVLSCNVAVRKATAIPTGALATKPKIMDVDFFVFPSLPRS